MATKTTTKKFNCKTATLAEFNRELKRLASQKCLTNKALKAEKIKAKKAELQAKYDAIIAETDRIRKVKEEKFGTRQTYMTMTPEEIARLTLEQTVAGIASLACRRSRYPHKAEETMAQEQLFQAHKAALRSAAEMKTALKGMTKEQIEQLLAEVK